MKPGDLVKVRPDLDDCFAGKLGLIIGFLDLESYFNPYEVLLFEDRRFYNENDLIIVTDER